MTVLGLFAGIGGHRTRIAERGDARRRTRGTRPVVSWRARPPLAWRGPARRRYDCPGVVGGPGASGCCRGRVPVPTVQPRREAEGDGG